MVHKIKPLREKLFELEPKMDLLHEILGFGRFSQVTETSDGFFLGRPYGAIGFDIFLGKPSDVAKERTRKLYNKLSMIDKAKVDIILFNSNINKKSLGLE